MNNKIKIKYAVNLMTLLSFVVAAASAIALSIYPNALGLERRDWGAIHALSGRFMIAFAILHVIVNWKIFVAMSKNFFKTDKPKELQD